jgi:hypothetical protein
VTTATEVQTEDQKVPAVVSPTEPKPRTLLQALADDVNHAAGQTVAAIVKTGERLINAKLEAGHGGWLTLFSGTELQRPIRFSVKTAERLIAIAKCPAFANSSDLSNFPPAVTVLEELARLPESLLHAALTTGTVHPEMTVPDVGKLYQAAGAKVPTRFVKWRGTAREQYGGGYYKVEPKPGPAKAEPEPDEPDFRETLDDATVNLNVPEQVALWVMQHGGILWTKELSGRDINPTFLREDGTRIDKIAQAVSEAQPSRYPDQQAAADKILDGLGHRNAIWQEDERRATQRKEPVTSDEAARAAHREDGKNLQRFMHLILDLGFRLARKEHRPANGGTDSDLKSLTEAKEILGTLIEKWKPL